jgi:hypothetical protein
MSDDADQADLLIEAALQDAIAAARRPTGPVATGYCLWCDEPLAAGRRWCGAECRDEWERGHDAARRR